MFNKLYNYKYGYFYPYLDGHFDIKHNPVENEKTQYDKLKVYIMIF